MSRENEQRLQDHIDAQGIRYPIVRAPDGMGTYGARFFPSYFTVSPDGEILTTPMERMPTEEWIEEALKSVQRAPELPEDPRYDTLRQAYEKEDYRRVDRYLARVLGQDDLDQEFRAVLEAQRALFDRRLARTAARVETLADGPDFWAATRKLEQVAETYDGLTVSNRAEEILDDFEKSARIRKEISAHRALDRVMKRYDATRIAQRRKLVDALLDVEKRFSGTYAATLAAERRNSLSP